MSIANLEPQVVWKNFYALTQIPRPSKHEGKVIDYLYNWGQSHGFETIKDDTGNIIIRVPATPGMENRKGVILQGHMDMVPQKTSDSPHNFLTDPISAYVDGEHGPLEVLVTYDEETGMTGANSLKPGILQGDILLNLDSEEEGELCVGCAGGLDVSASFNYYKYNTPAGMEALRFKVSGLQGGHSGMDISLYKGGFPQRGFAPQRHSVRGHGGNPHSCR